MREKKANRPRYWVAYLLRDLEEGATFSPEALRLTLIPWFVVDTEDEEIIKSFRRNFSKDQAFEVTIGRPSEFKSKRKIPINLIKPSPEIRRLHSKALEWLEKLEGRWAVKNPHVSEDYIPHIRRRQGYNLSEGDDLPISSLSLIRAHRRGDDLRTVAAKVALK